MLSFCLLACLSLYCSLTVCVVCGTRSCASGTGLYLHACDGTTTIDDSSCSTCQPHCVNCASASTCSQCSPNYWVTGAGACSGLFCLFLLSSYLLFGRLCQHTDFLSRWKWFLVPCLREYTSISTSGHFNLRRSVLFELCARVSYSCFHVYLLQCAIRAVKHARIPRPQAAQAVMLTTGTTLVSAQGVRRQLRVAARACG